MYTILRALIKRMKKEKKTKTKKTKPVIITYRLEDGFVFLSNITLMAY